jgi:hypothetical protein
MNIVWLPHTHGHYGKDGIEVTSCDNNWLEYDPEYVSYGECLSGNFVWSEDILLRYRRPQEIE